MDLICIKRRYKKVRKIVILSFIITLFIYTFLVVNHVQAEKRKEMIFSEDMMTIKQVIKEEQLKKQEEIQKTITRSDHSLLKEPIKSLNAWIIIISF